MSAQEPRFYSEAQLQRAAEQIESWREALMKAYRSELWDLAKLENAANEALARESERFTGEKRIARTILSRDIPKKRRRLNAALHLLEFANKLIQIDFVLGDEKTRDRLVSWVIRNGGIYHERGEGRAAVWVELLSSD
jgi:hypothetical protein